MLIENPDVFKSWLTSILEPLCDADPAALAKYVYALVKKDKPLEELREGMLDQLDVFLQHETRPFVDMLFTSLETNEYLRASPAPRAPTPAADPEKEPQVTPQTHPVTNGVSEEPKVPVVGPTSQRVVIKHTERPIRGPNEQTLVKVVPLNELLDEPVDQPPKRRERRVESLRDKDDRRRRRSRSWERRRPRRHLSPHADQRKYEKRRLLSRSPSPRRYRNRSPPLQSAGDRPPSRSRSRSPVPVRDRLHERERARLPREIERDRMSRDREHMERLSRSRDRDRSRDRSRERSRGSAGSPSRDLDRPSLPAFKRRCRDFDEKGYCMRGDLCQWDHGTDPLVLEDVLSMPRVPEYNPLAPDIWSGAGAGPGIPYPPHHHLPPPRELVPIPRIREAPPPPVPGAPALAPQPPRHPPPKKNFDFNRLGPARPPMSQNATNCSLEVKKVPRGLNDITHLNNHFGKFGKIVNIQVCFEGDPEGALITFSNHTEANVAYKSTEAVLNNRFIKVFWHNPESKQENVPPTGVPPKQDTTRAHNASHNKVLINKDNMKATQDIKQAADKLAKEAANGQETKKDATNQSDKSRQVMEMHKRAQNLLETQLQQQMLLIHKLESGNVTGPQKAALMEAINSAQEGIEKLRKELVAYNKMLLQVQEETVARSMNRLHLNQANAKRPKTREEAQKEILDAELDMFTKQQEGQDVTELMKKVAELRRQMSIQFPSHPAPRRIHSSRGGRYNTATRFTRNAAPAPKVFVNQSVDHRPRAVLISGFEADELPGLLKHFSQFGEVTGKEVNLAVPELILQFKVRSQAEQAALRGRNYNERTLSITWVTNNKPITPLVASNAVAQPPATPQNGETTKEVKELAEAPQEMSEDALLRFDEEEDEEAEEDRSWRR